MEDPGSEVAVELEGFDASVGATFWLQPGLYEVNVTCGISGIGGCPGYSYGGTASAQFKLFPDTSSCEQDLDGDSFVTLADLALLLLDWGFCPSCQADLNWDLNVDGSDLSDLLLMFGDCESDPMLLPFQPHYERQAALAAPAPTPLLADEPAQKPTQR